MKKTWVLTAVAMVLLGTIGLVVVKTKKGAGVFSRSASIPVQKLLDEAQEAQSQGDTLKARGAYQQILSEYPDYEKIEDIQNKLGALNMQIIFSTQETPNTVIHQIEPGDSLGKLAKQYGTTKELIKKSNGLKSDVIRVGHKLRIWKAPFTVLVSKSQNTLTLKSVEDVVKIYRVSTGKNNSTPVGTYKIASKIPNPVWFKPGGPPIPPESPENELGSRWMGFDEDPHYGIHGTLHPNVIGEQATAGCVRLINTDVEELFDILPLGTQVIIKD